ncbi:MAG: putative Ig domain-containing protein, partial [Acidobacteriia bacterium]|nr:putative Ig domain-containing protein [Terriglobia bacterium]
RWKKNGVDIAGATAASYAIPAAISADSGANFTVAAANAAGTATSVRATLAVTPAAGAPIIIANPARARILTGRTGTFSVTAWSASPLSYQWQKGTFTGNMADIPGATEAGYTTPPATLADHLTLFRCVVSNAAGNAATAGEMLFVTDEVKPPTDITSAITAAAQLGAPFQYAIASSGGTSPIAYSAVPLPPGLSVDAGSGRISGAPASAGTFAITVEAGNNAGKISRTLTLTVTAGPPAVSKGAWRLANFGAAVIDPAVAGDAADPDGDGYANTDEFAFGSNPLDAAGVPHALAVTPASLEFGRAAAGSSRRATLTIRNTGAGPISGAVSAAGPFAVVSGDSFALAPNAFAEVVVVFTPPTPGAYQGQLGFTSNGGARAVRLSGSAVPPTRRPPRPL